MWLLIFAKYYAGTLVQKIFFTIYISLSARAIFLYPGLPEIAYNYKAIH